MIKPIHLLIATIFFAYTGTAQNAKKGLNTLYYPEPANWEQKKPEALGIAASTIEKTIATAKAAESPNPRSMEENHYKTFGKEPFGDGIGPFEDRGDQTGIVIYKGYKIAEWGTPLKCDMTHSVAKSFLSAVIGLAVDAQLIRSVQDPVHTYVPPIELFQPAPVTKPASLFNQPELLHPFESVHNKTITWESMLRQTSDWEGTLWGKPDWADRPDTDPKKWLNRIRTTQGTVFEYNDVRVNALALAATSVFRQPLPQVLKKQIMDPIGASNTWRWTGYRNAWIVLDGNPVQSVSGGGHWGGGLFIHAEDMARFGLLTLRKGRWKDQQLLSESWIRQSTTPGPANKEYGYMNFYLNTDQKLIPGAPAEAFVHLGNGNNVVYVDPINDLVVVLRWITQKGMIDTISILLEGLRK
ncbi:serine hydrolase domain-containing protein [Sediminibacterium sp. TEGAF015]|uniref:serine hydrolase domain-containing protein n=1 Tax=Sediminibacterium sp. TEGAF015 TaxID=575378 RepID=UPI0021FA093E|nr:serine hydrolase [Sediminibacterium sp. TEGAF015]BDQ12239.1 serine hydrolase [Sediminibacterium sp. TEGAF015]